MPPRQGIDLVELAVDVRDLKRRVTALEEEEMREVGVEAGIQSDIGELRDMVSMLAQLAPAKPADPQ